MIYRVDRLSENSINPITGHEYDNSWLILMLTDSLEYQQMWEAATVVLTQ